MSVKTARPPRENIIRADFGSDVQLRAAGDGGPDSPIMFGHFARFNEWTEINSIFEGNFLERFAPGAFKKTFRENRAGMRCLFQHGFDPQVGDKPLGPIDDLREDPEGGYYEVGLLDAPYVRETVLPGLEAGLYGASFRFRVLREDIVKDPGTSDYNPKGLPERTVKEAEVREFGPVTFPAYTNASAGVRSLTDDFAVDLLRRNPERLRQLVEAIDDDVVEPNVTTEDESRDSGEESDETTATTEPDAAAQPHLEPERNSSISNAPPKTAPGSRPTPLLVATKSTHKKRSTPWLLP